MGYSLELPYVIGLDISTVRVFCVTMALHSYLCCYCNEFFDAPANSIDRTREVRCPPCTLPDPYKEDQTRHRLRITAGA